MTPAILLTTARMQLRQFEASSRGRQFVLVLETNEDPLGRLIAIAEESHIAGAHVTGIGAFSRAKVAFWNPEKKRYEPIIVDEQVEVLALSGNIARLNGKARVHAHIVLGRADGSTVGGHLLDACVNPTLELLIQEHPEGLTRRIDPATGLPLLAL